MPVNRSAVRAVAAELIRTEGARAAARHQRRQGGRGLGDRGVRARGGGGRGHRDHRAGHRGHRRGEGGGARRPHSLFLMCVELINGADDFNC